MRILNPASGRAQVPGAFSARRHCASHTVSPVRQPWILRATAEAEQTATAEQPRGAEQQSHGFCDNQLVPVALPVVWMHLEFLRGRKKQA